jgi:6-phosphogluconolactonase
MAVTIEIVPDEQALARRGAELFVSAAQGATAARGYFAAALSGGSTPRGLYETLASRFGGVRTPWPRIHLYWGDERCVPPDHPDSNYGMARAALIAHVALPPDNVHRMRGEDEPEAAALAYEVELHSPPLGPGIAGASAGIYAPVTGPPRRPSVVAPPRRSGSGGPPVPAPVPRAILPGLAGSAVPGETSLTTPPIIDLILLGLGNDGHTASLFPHTAPLREEERLCVVNTAPNGSTRLTVTFPVINAARRVMFVVTGAAKAGIVAEVIEGLRLPDAVPAQRVDPHPGELVWLLDEAAASELNPPTLAAARRIG